MTRAESSRARLTLNVHGLLGLMPANWLGLSLGVAPPTFVDRGAVEIVSGQQAGSTSYTVRYGDNNVPFRVPGSLTQACRK